jgi:hypothetical protein
MFMDKGLELRVTTEDQVKLLCTVLKTHPVISEILINGSGLTDKSCKLIAKVIKETNLISNVTLSLCDFGQAGLIEVFRSRDIVTIIYYRHGHAVCVSRFFFFVFASW